MSLSRVRTVSFVALFLLAACGDGDPAAPAPQDVAPGEDAIVQEHPAPVVPDAVGLPCDVKAALATNCARCHGADAKNGTTLLTRDDLLAASKKDPTQMVAERVAVRISDKEKPMPPIGKSEPMSSADYETLMAWLDDGMPAGRCDP